MYSNPSLGPLDPNEHEKLLRNFASEIDFELKSVKDLCKLSNWTDSVGVTLQRRMINMHDNALSLLKKCIDKLNFSIEDDLEQINKDYKFITEKTSMPL